MAELLFRDILHILHTAGPWLVFLVTASETALFIGLLIPAEATVLVAAFLASEGYFSIESVLLATVTGAFLGDQIGYALGRFGGKRITTSTGGVARLWRRYERSAQALFRRRSILAVTLARFISFVRTLTPWFAGMTRMNYGTYLAYDLMGVIGWSALSVSAGYLAGRSWHAAASALGVLSSALLAVLLLAAAGWFYRQRRLRMVRIALTGNVASGKSTIARVWESLGASIVDADELARHAVAPGTRGYREVRRHFGEGVLQPDRAIDRAALRRIVFADAAQRRVLEGIVHPEVDRLRRDRERALVRQGIRTVVHVIPLLFEVGIEDQFDAVVFVDAPEDVRLARIVHDRGLTPEDAQSMIMAQQPAAGKRAHATHIIENAGSLEQLEAAAEATWRELSKDAAGA